MTLEKNCKIYSAGKITQDKLVIYLLPAASWYLLVRDKNT